MTANTPGLSIEVPRTPTLCHPGFREVRLRLLQGSQTGSTRYPGEVRYGGSSETMLDVLCVIRGAAK